MERLRTIISSVFSLFFHLLAGGVIFYFWKPIALWYWDYRPVLGIDFYNLTTYVAFLADHFVLPFNGWKYIWYAGGPLSMDYPTLHAYLALPLLSYFNLPQAVQAYVLGSAFLFFFFSYLIFAEIGKDRVLAVILAIASAFSTGFYRPVIWGGGVHYFATQLFLPLVLYLLVKYFNTGDKRWYFLSAFFLGFSFLEHPQTGLTYSLPISCLLLLAFPIVTEKYFSWQKIKRVAIYLFIAILVGYPQLSSYLGRNPLEILVYSPKAAVNFINRTILSKKNFAIPDSSAPQNNLSVSQPDPELVRYHRDQIKRFYSDTNKTMFQLLPFGIAIFLASFVIRRQRKKSLKGVVYLLPVFWVVGYNSLQAIGVNFFQGGWFRSFWAFPLSLGIFISYAWGNFWASLKERFRLLDRKAIRIVGTLASGVLMTSLGVYFLSQNSSQQMLSAIERPGYRQQSSAFPDSLGYYIGNEEFEKLKTRVTPAWLNPDETQYRLYSPDARVNIWWNALFEMPLLKGYIEFPPGDAFTGAFYWTDIAITQTGENSDDNSLIKIWGTPEEIAYNNALFLLDWFSVKYIETGHKGTEAYVLPASYLIKNQVFSNQEQVLIPGWAQLYFEGYEPPDLPIRWHPESKQYLQYYEVKDDFVSPIMHPTNASVIGFIGKELSYHTFLRALATVNLNSRSIIPVRLGEFIDNVSYSSLKNMDALFLYNYDYKNHGKTWEIMENYVKAGGKVFIETGSEVKQTDSVNLPAKYPKELPQIFPIKMTKQEKIGDKWVLSSNAEEVRGIDLELFGPPMINGQPWLFSHPNSPTDLKEGARVILSANGIPLIVGWEYGSGKVIWSGVNFPYHITTHKSLEEGKLLKNLINDFIPTSPTTYSDFEVKRNSPNKVTIKGTGAKGVFFRENLNPGWKAHLSSATLNKDLKIYPAGPTFYGFSYVVLPEEVRKGSFEVTFSYRGEFWVYFWWMISLVTTLLIFDRVLFGARFLVPLFRKIQAPVKAKIGQWWERDKEE